MREAQLVLVVTAAMAAGLFVIAYALRSNWRETAIGKNIMAFMFVIFVFLGLALFFRFTGVQAPPWVGFICWILINVCLWWRLIILLRAQSAKDSSVMYCYECRKRMAREREIDPDYR